MGVKVAMVSTWKARCGIASYTENLSNALARQDVNVYIVRLPRYGYKEAVIFHNIIDRIPTDKIDLIHVQHEYGLFGELSQHFFQTLAKLEKPIVTTMHAVGKWEDDAVITNTSEKIIVHNKYCFDRLTFGEGIGAQNKAGVIPHGMTPLQTPLPPREVCKKRLGLQPEIPIIGYIGYISPYKGLESLLDAMVNVPYAGLLIGGGWFVEEDTQYIISLKQRSLDILPSRCQWLGFIPDEDLAMAYGAMDVVVYPSRFMTESGALLMALSHGKAVIASDLPPVREKEEKGALMTFKDTNDLSEKIRLLLKDSAMRYSLEENATKFAQENNWDAIAQRHINLYRTVTGKKHE